MRCLLRYRRWTSHSSFCSISSIPARRISAWSLGWIPTTSGRRPISLLTRSSGFVDRNFGQCSFGKRVEAEQRVLGRLFKQAGRPSAPAC